MRPKFDLRARSAMVVAGALTLTFMLSVSPSTAQSQTTETEGSAQAAQGPTATKASASLRVTTVRRHVVAGRRIVVRGVLRPARVGQAVSLQIRGRRGWVVVDRDRTDARGRYVLGWRARRTGSPLLRVHFAGTAQVASARARAGRAHVYRRAFASWYGPGLYGNKLGCGGRLSPSTIGVAHKTLPCGTRLTLHLRGRTVRVRVIDRGPYVGGREFDLTAATKRRLGFGSTGTILVAHR